jgi:hypothetical protein
MCSLIAENSSCLVSREDHSNRRTIFVADAHRYDGRRFIVQSDDKLTAFVELERQVLTVTFYLASVDAECAGGLS